MNQSIVIGSDDAQIDNNIKKGENILDSSPSFIADETKSATMKAQQNIILPIIKVTQSQEMEESSNRAAHLKNMKTKTEDFAMLRH